MDMDGISHFGYASPHCTETAECGPPVFGSGHAKGWARLPAEFPPSPPRAGVVAL